jgi:signal transduction histidine kinase
MVSYDLFLVALCGAVAFVLVRERTSPRPAGLRGRIRARGWGLVLLPVAVMAAVMAGGAHPLAAVEPAIAVILVIWAPRLAVKIAPYAVLALAIFGFMLVTDYRDGFYNQVRYGLVLAGLGSWQTRLVLLQALVFLALGGWLLLKVDAPGAGLLRVLLAWWRDPGRGGISPGLGLLLVPVTVLLLLLLGPSHWLGLPGPAGKGVAAIDAAIFAASLVLVFRSRVWAATLAAAALLALGGYGLVIAAYWPAVPGYIYGFSSLAGPVGAFGIAMQGTALLGLGLWLAPRVMREHLTPDADPELAARAQRLTERVQTLTQSRTNAVDTAAAELRRIERDLHDGAQARMVAVGMSLQAAERLFASNPQAALALVAEAKESSSRALTELRDLVRGIYPPVLADRGLGDAIKALALDTPLPVTLDVELPGTIELPVASAVYFSVAEALANVVKHAAARSVHIDLSHRGGVLRAEVTDNGAGFRVGADAAGGTGLAGVERRLATFDGILAVSSPPGGPTMVVIEVPCASSSAKTSSC